MQTPAVGVILLCLSVLGVSTHLVPHDMGVSTVGAVGMLCAAYLPRTYLMLPVLISLAVVDLLHGGYGALAMSFVYLGHVLAAYAARPVLGRVTPAGVVAAALVSAVVFYLVSNLTTMAMHYYPNTLAGWTACYLNGLPYLARGFAANLLFGALFFSIAYLVRSRYAHRFAAP